MHYVTWVWYAFGGSFSSYCISSVCDGLIYTKNIFYQSKGLHTHTSQTIGIIKTFTCIYDKTTKTQRPNKTKIYHITTSRVCAQNLRHINKYLKKNIAVPFCYCKKCSIFYAFLLTSVKIYSIKYSQAHSVCFSNRSHSLLLPHDVTKQCKKHYT